MSNSDLALSGKSVLMFVDDVYEDLELWYPRLRLIEAGARVVIAGMKAGKVYSGKNGYPCKSDASLSDIKESDFTGLVIPGGFAPDKLRRYDIVKTLTQAFHHHQKLVAHICHGGWIPISAGIVKGYTVTSTPGIKDDLINAGAEWIDKEVVIDRNQITSRKPDDLPAFCRECIKFLEQSKP